jgi:hypothetical protein
MSRSLDLFIDSDAPGADLAGRLGELAGLTFVAHPNGSAWVAGESGVEATLSAHPYVTDGPLWLSRYRYALSARVENGGRVTDSPEAAFLRRVYDKLQREPTLPALLVLDLQYRDRPAGSEMEESASGDQGAVPTADAE